MSEGRSTRVSDDGCRAARERLAALRDGELAPDERARVEAHLEACADCRAADARAAQVARALDGWAAPSPPEGLAERTRLRAAAALAARAEEPAAPAARRAPAAWAAAAAVLVGLLAGAAMAEDAWSRRPAPVAADGVGGAADAAAGFRVDSLGDAPDGSLVHAYWTLGADRE